MKILLTFLLSCLLATQLLLTGLVPLLKFEDLFHKAESYFENAHALIEKVQSGEVPHHQVTSLLCASLDYYLNGLARRPAHPKELVYYADTLIRLELEKDACRSFAGKPVFQNPGAHAVDILRYALRIHPHNPQTLYLASLAALRLGDRATALELLRKKQNSYRNSPRAQIQFAMKLVENYEHFKAGLPHRYPHILTWYSQFEPLVSEIDSLWQEHFLTKVPISLVQLEEEVSQFHLSMKGYQSALLSLQANEAIVREDGVRSRIDQKLSKLYKGLGEEELGVIFATRASQHFVPIVFATGKFDSDTDKAVIGRWRTWRHPRQLRLDVDRASIQLAFAKAFSPRLVLFQGSGLHTSLPVKSIGIRCGDSSRVLKQVLDYQIKSHLLDGRQLIAVQFPFNNFSFCEFYFQGIADKYNFGNAASQFVRVFGDEL